MQGTFLAYLFVGIDASLPLWTKSWLRCWHLFLIKQLRNISVSFWCLVLVRDKRESFFLIILQLLQLNAVICYLKQGFVNHSILNDLCNSDNNTDISISQNNNWVCLFKILNLWIYFWMLNDVSESHWLVACKLLLKINKKSWYNLEYLQETR